MAVVTYTPRQDESKKLWLTVEHNEKLPNGVELPPRSMLFIPGVHQIDNQFAEYILNSTEIYPYLGELLDTNQLTIEIKDETKVFDFNELNDKEQGELIKTASKEQCELWINSPNLKHWRKTQIIRRLAKLNA
jgi:hypothetical protein